MLSVFDGDQPAVRDGLAALPAGARAHWRQIALDTAVIADQAGMVQTLIAQGADPNAHIVMPVYTPAGYRIVLQQMKDDPDYAQAKSIDDLKKILPNTGLDLGPLLMHAISCASDAMVRTLVDRGASVHSTSQGHGKGPSMLAEAVLDGNAYATRLLLDHDANPCLHDRRKHPPSPHTLADLAREQGLPTDLVARLRCRAHLP